MDEEGHHHHHDDTVSSIVLREERPLDFKKLDQWMSYLVQEMGPDLYRYKGILHVAGEKRRVVFQGLHMLFAGHVEREWEENENKNKRACFFYRQKNLDRDWFQKAVYELHCGRISVEICFMRRYQIFIEKDSI
ncbi:hypothetical protein GCM10020331_007580 [Ectobacillus funiculus]